MKSTKEPPVVRAHSIIRSFDETLKFENLQITQGWDATYAGEMEDVQSVFDAVATSTPVGMSPIPPAVLVLGSMIQIVTHNVTMSLINNPALMGNANVQQLIGLLDQIRNDSAITKEVEDTPPYKLNIQPDGSVTVEELPEPTVE